MTKHMTMARKMQLAFLPSVPIAGPNFGFDAVPRASRLDTPPFRRYSRVTARSRYVRSRRQRTIVCSDEMDPLARTLADADPLAQTSQSLSTARQAPVAPTGPQVTSAAATIDDETDGPPREYDRDKLQAYWSARSMELNQRYLAFAGTAAPFVASVLRHVATRTLTEDQVVASLAVQAREGMESLGPTYVKMGQMMSIRPDIIPQPAMVELQKLQDGVSQFDNEVARKVVEDDLGRPIDEIFSEFSDTPIAAASLAQVYRARLRDSGVEVAVKVQRPDALTLCSKDMYVLQRAVGVYQGVMRRWTAQEVDYEALLSSFASGFYEELDFAKEGRNQEAARSAILEAMGGRVYVPKVFTELCARRVLVTEFVYGTKLTSCEPDELRRLTAVGQECFLKQLLEPGQFLHADPHGGNLLKPNIADARKAHEATLQAVADQADEIDEDTRASAVEGTLQTLGIEPQLFLLDFGLTAGVPEDDKPRLIVAIVHMANKDWAAVTDDFVALGFLPSDIDRGTITPLLERVLAPYVLDGGGASAYIKDGVFSASFQGLMRDLSAAAVDIPFSIPAYWPVVGRAIAILEGIALTGDPDYKIVLSAYPFVTQKLLKEGSDESFRAALNAILYPRNADGVRQPRPSPRRIAALINNALGRAANNSGSAAMIDLDAMPDEENAASMTESIAFLGGDDARAVREVLMNELVEGADLVLRSLSRRLATSLENTTSVALPLPALPFLPKPRIPVLNPVALIPADVRERTLDRVAPPLSTEEEVFAGDALELAKSLLGVDLRDLTAQQTSPLQLLTALRPAVASLGASFVGGTQNTVTVDADNPLREVAELLVESRTETGDADDATQAVREQARAALRDIADELFQRLRQRQEERLGIRSDA